MCFFKVKTNGRIKTKKYPIKPHQRVLPEMVMANNSMLFIQVFQKIFDHLFQNYI